MDLCSAIWTDHVNCDDTSSVFFVRCSYSVAYILLAARHLTRRRGARARARDGIAFEENIIETLRVEYISLFGVLRYCLMVRVVSCQLPVVPGCMLFVRQVRHRAMPAF